MLTHCQSNIPTYPRAVLTTFNQILDSRQSVDHSDCEKGREVKFSHLSPLVYTQVSSIQFLCIPAYTRNSYPHQLLPSIKQVWGPWRPNLFQTSLNPPSHRLIHTKFDLQTNLGLLDYQTSLIHHSSIAKYKSSALKCSQTSKQNHKQEATTVVLTHISTKDLVGIEVVVLSLSRLGIFPSNIEKIFHAR